MLFSLKIESSGDAFSNGEGVAEVARLLRKVANDIEKGKDGGPLFDVNGNRCGRYDMRKEEEE
jgi:hypothetical protein